MHRASILLCLGLAACGASSNSSGTSHANTATAGTSDGTGAGPGSDVECHDETSTGSSISHQVCRSKFQSDQDRKGAQDMLGAPRAAPAVPGGH